MLSKEELHKYITEAVFALEEDEDDEDEDFDARHGDLLQALSDEENLQQIVTALDELEPADEAPLARATREHYFNWLGEGGVQVAAILDDVPHLDALKERLASLDNPIRVCGARHSDNHVARPDPGSLLVDLSNWRLPNPSDVPLEEVEIDDTRYVRMFAWETLQDIADRSKQQGFSLVNTGSFTHQTLAGPLSVGTHGSGSELGAMCDQVLAIDILALDGYVYRVVRPGMREFLSFDEETHSYPKVDLPNGRGHYVPIPKDGADFFASVVNLGTLGVVLSYMVEVMEPYWLHQSVERKEVMEGLDEYFADLQGVNSGDWRHVELLVMPEPTHGGQYECVLIRRKLSPVGENEKTRPTLPATVRMLQDRPGRTRTMGKLLSRSAIMRQCMYAGALNHQLDWDGQTGPWDDVLVRNTGVPAHSFEVAVPVYQAKHAVQCVLEGIKEAGEQRPKSKPTSPIGVRFVHSSKQYMAMTYEQVRVGDRLFPVHDWCFIEVPRLLGTRNQEKIPLAIVDRLRSRGVIVRLHWGQYAPPNARDARLEYPKLRNWLGSRVSFGAGPRWLTKDLCSVFGLPEPARFVSRQQPFIAPPPVRTNIPLDEFEKARQESPLVLCIHGIGDHRDGNWREEWASALTESLAAARLRAPRFAFVGLDDLFEKEELTPEVLGEAALQFLSSWMNHGFSRSIEGKALEELGEWVEWLPGMVAKWGESEDLRRRLRQRVVGAIEATRPLLIAAHSLGSLVAYDTLTHKASRGAAVGRDEKPYVGLVTFGSQIGHPSVRYVWGGRIEMPHVRAWHHVHNPKDPVFTAPIRLLDDRFVQTEISDVSGSWLEQHSAASYLGHAAVAGRVVGPMLRRRLTPATRMDSFPSVVRRKSKGEKRALLLGVNQYKNREMNLEGCVNDTYLMRQVLQTHFDYDDDEVRVVVNAGATAASLRDQLNWLLDGASPGQRRFFYFSGHGAQLPGYNALEAVDHQDECLVPHDFDWYDRSTALLDDQFFDLYSQLNDGTGFVMVLDCCHSGGMARAGGATVRGLSPPDDIRHQLLSFSAGRWSARRLLNEGKEGHGARKLATVRTKGFFGGARSLRGRVSEAERAARGHRGPFMPALLYACQETELAFEHRVGAATHGAFTYALCENLSDPTLRESTLHDVVHQAAQGVRSLGYQQTPYVEGPGEVVHSPYEL